MILKTQTNCWNFHFPMKCVLNLPKDKMKAIIKKNKKKVPATGETFLTFEIRV